MPYGHYDLKCFYYTIFSTDKNFSIKLLQLYDFFFYIEKKLKTVSDWFNIVKSKYHNFLSL